jgi:hypothetical protein
MCCSHLIAALLDDGDAFGAGFVGRLGVGGDVRLGSMSCWPRCRPWCHRELQWFDARLS